MKFNSQIATSRSQSERLLALGLKKETADMIHMWHWEFDGYTLLTVPWERAHRTTEDIPAWSLHRLMRIAYNSGTARLELFEDDDAYEILIYKIEWLIKEGYFNKEYLV